LRDLELRFELLTLFLGALALGDVANVALNNSVLADPIHVADEFDTDEPTVSGLEWQVFVADVFLVLQFLEGSFRDSYVL
jgi:hypothetical protein